MTSGSRLFDEYGGYHRDRRNLICHEIGIPLIVLGIIALLRLVTFSGIEHQPRHARGRRDVRLLFAASAGRCAQRRRHRHRRHDRAVLHRGIRHVAVRDRRVRRRLDLPVRRSRVRRQVARVSHQPASSARRPAVGREPSGAHVSILVVCAVAQELAALPARDGVDVVATGVGPVEAAFATARALAVQAVRRRHQRRHCGRFSRPLHGRRRRCVLARRLRRPRAGGRQRVSAAGRARARPPRRGRSRRCCGRFSPG